jgi:serine/threonine protein kinase
MSRFTCTYCGRTFAERVRRPPDCPTQDCCDIQEMAEAEEADPITEMLGRAGVTAAPAPPPVPASPPPAIPAAPPPPSANAPSPPLVPTTAAGLTTGSLVGGFVITGAATAVGADTYYAGAHRVSGDQVRIRQYRAVGTQHPGIRAEVRKLIESHNNPAFLRLLHLEPMGGVSIEVLEGPHGTSLREIAANQPMSLDELRPLISHLAALLSQLHTPKSGRSIVHRGLSLDTVFARPNGDDTHALELGGWETAMVVTAGAEVTYSIPLPDLRTCPPEAAGKTTFCFDDHAKAWDWWSLGRLAQELALGRHVFELLPTEGVEAQHLRQSIMLDEDTTRFSAKGVRYRPGLVEIMGVRVEPSVRSLLRGLLACNPRARWGAASVEAWSQGAKLDDPYDLSAIEPIFVWDGKSFPLSEAAKYLLTQAAWDDAVSNFVDSANPKRLSYQVLHVYKARRYIEAFDSASKLLTEPALAECPRSLREGLAASLFLSSVAECRETMIIAGRHLDQAWVLERLNEATTPETTEKTAREIAALLETSILRRIETQFAATGRMLREVQAIYQEARRPLERQRDILDLRNTRDLIVLLKLVFADPAYLAQEAETTRQQFHDAGVSPWKEIWASPPPLDPAAHVLILIARMDVRKARLRTAEQWANEQIDALRADAARYYNFLVHDHAYRSMTWGIPTFGGPIAFAIFVLLGGAALLHGLGHALASPAWALIVPATLALRALGVFLGSQYLTRRLGTPVSLPLVSPTAYLLGRVEKLMVVVKGQRQYSGDVLSFVENANDEIRRLTPPNQSARTFDCDRPVSLWAIAVGHWLLLISCLLLALSR